LVTRRGRIRGVVKRWRAQYKGRLDNHVGRDETPRAVLERLEALDLDTCSRHDVAVAIHGEEKARAGSEDWTAIHCDACDVDVDAAVQVGQEPDYASATALICEACLNGARALLGPPVLIDTERGSMKAAVAQCLRVYHLRQPLHFIKRVRIDRERQQLLAEHVHGGLIPNVRVEVVDAPGHVVDWFERFVPSWGRA
jgi:hypothetical protein